MTIRSLLPPDESNSRMELSSKVNDRTLVLTIQGRLNAFGSKELEGYLETRTAKDLLCTVFDMAGVNYISSAGLRVLLKLQQKLKGWGGMADLTAQDAMKQLMNCVWS